MDRQLSLLFKVAGVGSKVKYGVVEKE